MRDHSRRKHCLICGNVADSDGQPAASKSVPEAKSTRSEEGRSADAPKPEVQAPEPPRFVHSPALADVRGSPVQPPIEAAPTPQRASTTATTPNVLDEDIQAILQEISRSTAKLATVSHPSEGVLLAEYIAKLADAAAAMHRLQSQLHGFN